MFLRAVTVSLSRMSLFKLFFSVLELPLLEGHLGSGSEATLVPFEALDAASSSS